MGRWATSRRRGGGRSSAPALGPPPKPSLADVATHIVQTSPGADNTGGLLTLYFSLISGGPYAPAGGTAWASTWDWGGDPPNNAGFYVATSTGNGTAYAGESVYSDQIIFAP